MKAPVCPERIAASLDELWSPRVIAEVDEFYVKVARVEGTFTWHAHDGEDELFHVLRGRLRIEMEDDAVELGPGETFVVPKGVRHCPAADEETLILLLERKTTRHTGDEVTDRTRGIEGQLRAP